MEIELKGRRFKGDAAQLRDAIAGEVARVVAALDGDLQQDVIEVTVPPIRGDTVPAIAGRVATAVRTRLEALLSDAEKAKEERELAAQRATSPTLVHLRGLIAARRALRALYGDALAGNPAALDALRARAEDGLKVHERNQRDATEILATFAKGAVWATIVEALATAPAIFLKAGQASIMAVRLVKYSASAADVYQLGKGGVDLVSSFVQHEVSTLPEDAQVSLTFGCEPAQAIVRVDAALAQWRAQHFGELLEQYDRKIPKPSGFVQGVDKVWSSVAGHDTGNVDVRHEFIVRLADAESHLAVSRAWRGYLTKAEAGTAELERRSKKLDAEIADLDARYAAADADLVRYIQGRREYERSKARLEKALRQK